MWSRELGRAAATRPPWGFPAYGNRYLGPDVTVRRPDPARVAYIALQLGELSRFYWVKSRAEQMPKLVPVPPAGAAQSPSSGEYRSSRPADSGQ